MPFGFGKKKKSSSLVEKELSPPPQPSKEAESADVVAEKVEETAYSPEDAQVNNADQVTVAVTETAVVVEESVVEMVTSDAMDGGADHVVETEMVITLFSQYFLRYLTGPAVFCFFLIYI